MRALLYTLYCTLTYEKKYKELDKEAADGARTYIGMKPDTVLYPGSLPWFSTPKLRESSIPKGFGVENPSQNWRLNPWHSSNKLEKLNMLLEATTTLETVGDGPPTAAGKPPGDEPQIPGPTAAETAGQVFARPGAKSPRRPPNLALARVSERVPPPGTRKPRDRSIGEAGDAYTGVQFHVPGTNYRVAASADGWCWIIQQREARDHWIGRKYFSNRRRLAVVLKELVPPKTYKEIEPQIHALPV